jgi:zona occludens toxin (predicted ATPase)
MTLIHQNTGCAYVLLVSLILCLFNLIFFLSLLIQRASTAGYSDAPPAFNSTDDQHTASSLFGCCFPSKAPLAMSIRERAEAAETAESSKKCVIL